MSKTIFTISLLQMRKINFTSLQTDMRLCIPWSRHLAAARIPRIRNTTAISCRPECWLAVHCRRMPKFCHYIFRLLRIVVPVAMPSNYCKSILPEIYLAFVVVYTPVSVLVLYINSASVSKRIPDRSASICVPGWARQNIGQRTERRHR